MTFRFLPDCRSTFCHEYLDYDSGCGACPLKDKDNSWSCRRDWRNVEFNPADYLFPPLYKDNSVEDWRDKSTVNEMNPHDVELAKQWIRDHVRKQDDSVGILERLNRETGIDMTNNQFKQLMAYYGFMPNTLHDYRWKFNVQLI